MLFSLLFLLNFLELLHKAFSYMVQASLSPGQIKSKVFNKSEEAESEWKRCVLAFIPHQNTLSLALIKALPYFEQP